MHYSIHFPADCKNITPIRDMVYHIARLQEFDEQSSQHLRSVADELVSNAIEHGSQSTSEVLFEIYADETMVKLICVDQGHGNKMKAKDIEKKIVEPVLLYAMRGRGVSQIVKSFVSELDFRDRPEGGIIVTAVYRKGT